MKEILETYNIDSALSHDAQLAQLEIVKQKLLRKLNHVFGDSEKEEKLNLEMNQLEQAMELLRAEGGFLSLDDVKLETRELSQSVVCPGRKKEIEIQEKERMLREKELSEREKTSLIIDVVVYYLQNHIYDKFGYWCQYGAQLGYGYFMSLMHEYHSKELFGVVDSQKAFYWLKKAAQAGEKDCCEKLGKVYLSQKSPMFDLQQAAIWSVKAADAEHPNAYLQAFTAFYSMRQFEKAEICLKTAYDMDVPGAAYRMALMYDVDDNKTGERQIEVAKYWYEKAYMEAPDGNVCYGLGNIYLELEETDLGIKLLMQGHQEFGDEDCLETLKEWMQEQS